MAEAMSDERLAHISGCLSAPCEAPLAEAFAHELLAEVDRLRADKLNTDAFLMLVLHRYGSMSFSENDVRRAAEWWNAVQAQVAAAEQQPEDGDRG